nr:HAMP domain-containing sensor histidine kinase [Fusibacter paucivorans]
MGQHQKRFIGNVTHEFRTPLTVIKAYADLIQMYESDRELHGEAAAYIQKEVSRLSEMVNRVLRLTAMEHYDFQLKCEVLNLGECLEVAVQHVHGKAQHRGLEMIQAFEPVCVYADREAVMQIAINLLDNAIKYNRPNGRITIRCFEMDQMACLEVADTGVGISESEKTAIFEPFYRIDQSRAGDDESSGIGLALVKGLVEKLGGQITVEDEVTGGTRFTVRMPIA